MCERDSVCERDGSCLVVLKFAKQISVTQIPTICSISKRHTLYNSDNSMFLFLRVTVSTSGVINMVTTAAPFLYVYLADFLFDCHQVLSSESQTCHKI